MRNGDLEEKVMNSDSDPLRTLAVTMTISEVKPEIYLKVSYDDFDLSTITTDYVFRLDNLQNPHFELIKHT
jgi:hypothetical protein